MIYDHQMMFDQTQQLLGELKLQQLELEGKPLPPGIQRGVERFRAKYGDKTLVPPLDDFDAVLADFNEEAGERRKALAALRKQQFDKVMAYVEVLKALGVIAVKRSDSAG